MIKSALYLFCIFVFCVPFGFISQRYFSLNPDTLNVGYTYWWPNTNPLLDFTAEKCPLVFIGKVSNLGKVIMPNEEEPLAITQKGTIEIITLIKHEGLPKQKFIGQKYFSSDCFYESNLKIGNLVLVFCYAYEQMYCIPGKESILKISDY
tara:strand:+ start:67 stop:516 length:450 start_codon:yes stop_codon:yes gene_type:complete